MMTLERVDIELEGEIDFVSAQILVSRIRAAMQNGMKEIRLILGESCMISSAELLGFLAASSRHLAENDGKLSILGAAGKCRGLFEISQLGHLLEEKGK